MRTSFRFGVLVLAAMTLSTISVQSAGACGKAGDLMFSYQGASKLYKSEADCLKAKTEGEGTHIITPTQEKTNPGLCCSKKWHFVYGRNGCAEQRSGQFELTQLKQVCE